MLGKIICDLIPNELNNRNSEGAFIRLKSNDILFVYTRYRGKGKEDHSEADLYGIISSDDGETFGKPFLVFSCEAVGADNIMSVSLMRMKNGNIGLFYLQKQNEIHTCIPYFTISEDEGKTWGEHIRCIKEDGYYVLNNDRVITLSNGRILMPIAQHIYENGVYGPGKVFMCASDDEGKTWYKISNDIKIDFSECKRKNFNAICNFMEPGIVQLENGTIWCYIRTDLGRQYETFSEDFGVTWSKPLSSPFTAPDSPMCVKRLKNGDLFAVWNPIPIYNGKSTLVDGVWTGARNPLVFAVLDKEGSYAPEYRKIETDEKSGFCYCAIYELENGAILLGYCAGGVSDNGCLNRLRIRKIYKNEI